MTNIRLHIAYDGTDYVGWQRQIKEHGKSVQGELEKALSLVLHEEVSLIGAGRTDTGVHAREQIANFHTKCSIPPANIPQALLGFLPDDIVVWQAEEVAEDFHSRFTPHIKTYAYNMISDNTIMPWNRRYNYFLRKEPDWSIIEEATKLFIGKHNFKAFCATGSSANTYEREIIDCKLVKIQPCLDLLPWQQTGETYVIEVSGRGFLYKMVRIITGSLLKAGLGKISIDDIKEALQNPVKIIAPGMPAQGLFLKSIVYDQDKEETS